MGPSVPGSHAYMGILCSPCRPPARPTICQELNISNNQIHKMIDTIYKCDILNPIKEQLA